MSNAICAHEPHTWTIVARMTAEERAKHNVMMIPGREPVWHRPMDFLMDCDIPGGKMYLRLCAKCKCAYFEEVITKPDEVED